MRPSARKEGRGFPSGRLTWGKSGPSGSGSTNALDASRPPADLPRRRRTEPGAPAPFGGSSRRRSKQTSRVEGIALGNELFHRVQPRYPEPARLRRIRGRVVLEAIIDRQGSVTDVRVLRSVAGLDE